ncbi:hypothetical protein [Lentzea kentuckyensis]|uniref:hypothetical protein n=1 Tax=Lentzea kentuckyensis TaxID=360086 RepID=UPI000A3C209A|nr:hypothetical protein [Lentzea kentuckyensis]
MAFTLNGDDIAAGVLDNAGAVVPYGCGDQRAGRIQVHRGGAAVGTVAGIVVVRGGCRQLG